MERPEMIQQSPHISFTYRKGIRTELFDVDSFSPAEVVVRNEWVRMVKCVIVEVRRGDEESLHQSGTNVPQSVIRRHVILNRDVLDERAEVGKESSEYRQWRNPKQRITPPSMADDRHCTEQCCLAEQHADQLPKDSGMVFLASITCRFQSNARNSPGYKTPERG